jgi:hypothetical protein
VLLHAYSSSSTCHVEIDASRYVDSAFSSTDVHH